MKGNRNAVDMFRAITCEQVSPLSFLCFVYFCSSHFGTCHVCFGYMDVYGISGGCMAFGVDVRRGRRCSCLFSDQIVVCHMLRREKMKTRLPEESPVANLAPLLPGPRPRSTFAECTECCSCCLAYAVCPEGIASLVFLVLWIPAR